MAEPASSVAFFAVTTAGLTVLGVVTGIHPALLIAGAAGGYWSLSYLPQMTAKSRVSTVAVSAIISALLSPAAAAVIVAAARNYLPWWPASVDANFISYAVAAIGGLLLFTVVGPQIIRIGNARAGQGRR